MRICKSVTGGVLSFLVLLVLASCNPGKMVEAAMETALRAEGVDADFNTDNSEFSVTTAEGTVTVNVDGGTIPADFPSDVTLPSGANITGTVATEDGFMVSLDLKRPLAKVLEDMAKDLTAKGWVEASNMTYTGGAMVQYAKDDRVLAIMASETDGVTGLTVTTDAP